MACGALITALTVGAVRERLSTGLAGMSYLIQVVGIA